MTKEGLFQESRLVQYLKINQHCGGWNDEEYNIEASNIQYIQTKV